LTKPTPSGGPSILQRFHRTGRDLIRNGVHPQLALVTNRSIHPHDPVLTLRDRNDRLADRLRYSTSAATVAARREIVRHLGCTDDELYELLAHLRLHTDASEAAWRDYHVRDISYAAGVRADDSAFRLGISEVREWVKTKSITGCDHAYAVALAIRNLAREIARTANPSVLHLFMAAPAAFAVLLGGVWDRVPTTQTYEDLAGDGYEQTFLIPN
jgi:SMODS-associated and fused to various effectors sensor domain